MIQGRRILAIIPARGGSKGVPRKNIRLLGEKPLLAWTIHEANKSKYIDRLILTSEDEEIIKVAHNYGLEVPFRRPADLALDCTPGIDPVIHAIETLTEKYDFVVLLQVTSPLRTVVDIDNCIEKLVRNDAKACVAVTEADNSPYWMYKVGEGSKLKPLFADEKFTRRQELPQVYSINGAVYVASCDWLIKNKDFITNETIAYVMPPQRSLDIDTELDFAIVEHLIKNQLLPSPGVE